MSKRILIVDEGEYTAKEIKEVQGFINGEYEGIELLLNPTKVLAICDIKYSIVQIYHIFGEAYISINGGTCE
jgi:hypothetical protein